MNKIILLNIGITPRHVRQLLKQWAGRYVAVQQKYAAGDRAVRQMNTFMEN